MIWMRKKSITPVRLQIIQCCFESLSCAGCKEAPCDIDTLIVWADAALSA